METIDRFRAFLEDLKRATVVREESLDVIMQTMSLVREEMNEHDFKHIVCLMEKFYPDNWGLRFSFVDVLALVNTSGAHDALVRLEAKENDTVLSLYMKKTMDDMAEGRR